MAGPLEDVIVIDLSQGMAGAMATMLLADYGANVIKIEPTETDFLDSAAGYTIWNRGKRSVAINLSTPKAWEVLHRLLETADILLETSQPGTMALAGLDYDSLHSIYPRLIYCSLTGYGQEGPDRDRPNYDGLVQARVGLQGQRWGAQGSNTREGPLYMAFPAPSYSGGFLACAGILTALHAREQTGIGQHVDTSMADGAILMQRWSWAEKPIVARPVNEAGVATVRRGIGTMVRWFKCADEKYLWLHTMARGAPDRLAKAWDMEPFLDSLDWESITAMEARQQIGSYAEGLMASKTRADWMEILDDADIPNRPVLKPGEAFEDEQLSAIDMIATLQDPQMGPLKQVGLPFKFSDTPGYLSSGAPRHGEHTMEILEALDFTSQDLASLRDTGAISPNI